MKKNIWENFEADNWFLRNRSALNKKSIKEDIIIFLLKLYKIIPKKVIDIGAANGYRLSFIQKLYGSEVVAVEPSLKAIKDGKSKYPYIQFIHSTCENTSIKKKFDLVIASGVFFWIYRENLFSCLKNIDSLVKDGGYLIISCFGTENFIKKRYHHLKKGKFFTWKMPYWELFTKSGSYLEIAKLRYDHDKKKLTTAINLNNQATTVLLKKQSNFILIP